MDNSDLAGFAFIGFLLLLVNAAFTMGIIK